MVRFRHEIYRCANTTSCRLRARNVLTSPGRSSVSRSCHESWILFARRLQVQERLTSDIADALCELLHQRGWAASSVLPLSLYARWKTNIRRSRRRS